MHLEPSTYYYALASINEEPPSCMPVLESSLTTIPSHLSQSPTNARRYPHPSHNPPNGDSSQWSQTQTARLLLRKDPTTNVQVPSVAWHSPPKVPDLQRGKCLTVLYVRLTDPPVHIQSMQPIASPKQAAKKQASMSHLIHYTLLQILAAYSPCLLYLLTPHFMHTV